VCALKPLPAVPAVKVSRSKHSSFRRILRSCFYRFGSVNFFDGPFTPINFDPCERERMHRSAAVGNVYTMPSVRSIFSRCGSEQVCLFLFAIFIAVVLAYRPALLPYDEKAYMNIPLKRRHY
jgi:hypothetical protein